LRGASECAIASSKSAFAEASSLQRSDRHPLRAIVLPTRFASQKDHYVLSDRQR
jgi:hypothetical protein